MLRPYSFEEKQAGGPQDYRLLKERATALNRMQIPEDGMLLLEQTCFMDAADFEALVKVLEKSGYPLTEQLGPVWTRAGGARCNSWYDVAMICPFFRDFEAPAGQGGERKC